MTVYLDLSICNGAKRRQHGVNICSTLISWHFTNVIAINITKYIMDNVKITVKITRLSMSLGRPVTILCQSVCNANKYFSWIAHFAYGSRIHSSIDPFPFPCGKLSLHSACYLLASKGGTRWTKKWEEYFESFLFNFGTCQLGIN